MVPRTVFGNRVELPRSSCQRLNYLLGNILLSMLSDMEEQGQEETGRVTESVPNWDSQLRPGAGCPAPCSFFARGRGLARRCLRSFHATTDTPPCCLRVGLTIISTSWPSGVRKSMRRSTEGSGAVAHQCRNMRLLDAENLSASVFLRPRRLMDCRRALPRLERETWGTRTKVKVVPT